MNLDPICDYIAANTDLVVAENLFSYSIPAQVSNAVLLVAESANGFVDHEIPGIFKNRYQVIVRDAVYETAKTRADELFDLLNLREVDMGEYVVTHSLPRHKPFPFRRSDGDLVEFSINFDVRYRE